MERGENIMNYRVGLFIGMMSIVVGLALYAFGLNMWAFGIFCWGVGWNTYSFIKGPER
jgi:hypothetical protein